MENAAKNAKLSLSKGKNLALTASNLATNLAANQVNKVTSMFDFGPFGNIIMSLSLIFILYKVFNTLFYGSFNYSNQLEFLIRSYYYWTIILVIMVVYISLTNM